MQPFTVYHRSIGLLHAFKAVVAIHRIVAAHHRRNLTDTDLFDFCLKLLDKAKPAVRRHITPVHKAMDIHVVEPTLFGHFKQRVQMLVMAVDAAIGNKAVCMELLPVFLSVFHRLNKLRLLKETAVFNILCDAGELLIDDTPRADIQMPDFRITHLSGRQSNIHT